MHEKERHRLGLEKRRHMLGSDHVERALECAGPLEHDFQDLITRYAWGEIWTRPGLDSSTRRLLTLGTLVALGRFEEFEMHLRAGLAQGDITPEGVQEVLLQQAIYCGVPAANQAFKLFRRVLASLAASSADAQNG